MYFPRLVNIYRPPLLEAKETPGPIDGSAWAMRPAVIVGARCSFGAWPKAHRNDLPDLMRGPKNGACGMRTFVRLADAGNFAEYDEVDLLAAQRSLFPPTGKAPLGVQNPDVQLWHHARQSADEEEAGGNVLSAASEYL